MKVDFLFDPVIETVDFAIENDEKNFPTKMELSFGDIFGVPTLSSTSTSRAASYLRFKFTLEKKDEKLCNVFPSLLNRSFFFLIAANKLRVYFAILTQFSYIEEKRFEFHQKLQRLTLPLIAIIIIAIMAHFRFPLVSLRRKPKKREKEKKGCLIFSPYSTRTDRLEMEEEGSVSQLVPTSEAPRGIYNWQSESMTRNVDTVRPTVRRHIHTCRKLDSRKVRSRPRRG